MTHYHHLYNAKKSKTVMGFSMTILLEIPIDPTTGLPSLNNVSVLPQRFLRFVEHKGAFLTYYVPEELDGQRAHPHTLLDAFPLWEEVAEHVSSYRHVWTEEDHNLFREALVWLSQHEYYAIHWSY